MSEINSFNELEEKLAMLAGPGINPGLGRISRLLLLLDNPERKFKAIHIVGTNGKGSTSVTIASILKESGYTVAVYTSPHLISPGERLVINGKKISPDRWQNSLLKVEELIKEDSSLSEKPPTYFEIITAIAFFIIAEEKVDIAVVEAGLGGRLDATNILKNVILTLLVSISIDHTEYLGNSLREIANEKFAVLRKDVPAVFQGGDDYLNSLFLQQAKKVGAQSNILSDICTFNTTKLSEDGTSFILEKNNSAVLYHTPLIGFHQTKNATLALIGADILEQKFNKIDDKAKKIGVSKAKISGRFELISKKPIFILDGAHNPAAMKELVNTVAELFGKTHVNIVITMMRDKDIKESLTVLSKLNCSLICTEVPGMSRSMKAFNLAREAQKIGLDVLSTNENPLEAVRLALSLKGITISCGSLYLVGFLKNNIADLI
ncbi:MAG: bifunctional folylpolyglutamate synthase/dihydrofolate synthase [Synergistaceae bacterium]|nr:bifunctional folylpolyglutamate synthase/dihydrofolate synthase [Synergistaceae bacterium]